MYQKLKKYWQKHLAQKETRKTLKNRCVTANLFKWFLKLLPCVNLSGESLIEVITAIFVVVIGSSVTTSLIVTSTQSNSFNRENLIALNLAEEGLEAMRNIRETNWLRFSFNKEKCWNIQPLEKSCEPVLTADKTIADGNYTVQLNPDFAWRIDQQSSPLNLDPSSLDASKAFQLKLQKRLDQNLYVHSAGFALTESPFYRMIKISYSEENKIMKVVSTVQWLHQGKKHEITISGRLANYQKN